MSASPVPEACLRLPAQILGLGLALCKAGQCSALMALTVPDLEPLLTSRWELSQQSPSSLGSGAPCAELPLSAAETGVPAFVLTLFLSPACPSAACLCRFPSLPEGWAPERAHHSPCCPPRPETCHGPVWCHRHLLLSPGLLLALTQRTRVDGANPDGQRPHSIPALPQCAPPVDQATSHTASGREVEEVAPPLQGECHICCSFPLPSGV